MYRNFNVVVGANLVFAQPRVRTNAVFFKWLFLAPRGRNTIAHGIALGKRSNPAITLKGWYKKDTTPTWFP
jgi:hypothetical protein